MTALIVRRRRLGRTSCREIKNYVNARNPARVVVSRNDRLGRHDLGEFDTLIRWGCTAQVGIRRVINKSEAIHEVNDKLNFRRKLDDAGLCPRTWFNIEDVPREAINNGLVTRPERHAQGRRLFVSPMDMPLREAVRRAGEPYYISDLIPKVAEYRVFVVQGRVACVAKKTPGNPEDVAWNVARGGYFENVRWGDWPLKAVKLSVEAFELSSLDFGGVDVMVDAEGRAYVLEINSAPSLTSPYRQECMAKALNWMLDNGTERIARIDGRGGYRKFIHPAVCDRAQLVMEEAA